MNHLRELTHLYQKSNFIAISKLFRFVRKGVLMSKGEGPFLIDPEGANKILEFILQICERIHKIGDDGTDRGYWGRFGRV